MKVDKHQGNKKSPQAPVSKMSTSFWRLQQWQREIDRLFGNPVGHWLMNEDPFTQDWTPAINVYEEKDNVLVEAELPGMRKEEIHIYMSADDLNISGEIGEAREEKERNTYRFERHFGRFHRVIPLPCSVKADAIKAHYRDGILTVICPKGAEGLANRTEVKVDLG